MIAGWLDAPPLLRDFDEVFSITKFRVCKNNIRKEGLKTFLTRECEKTRTIRKERRGGGTPSPNYI